MFFCRLSVFVCRWVGGRSWSLQVLALISTGGSGEDFLTGLTGFDFGFWSAGVAGFGLMPGRDVEVGLGDLVPPVFVEKIFWLTCKSVQTRVIKVLRSSVMRDDLWVMSLGENISGVKIVNGRSCEGNVG